MIKDDVNDIKAEVARVYDQLESTNSKLAAITRDVASLEADLFEQRSLNSRQTAEIDELRARAPGSDTQKLKLDAGSQLYINERADGTLEIQNNDRAYHRFRPILEFYNPDAGYNGDISARRLAGVADGQFRMTGGRWFTPSETSGTVDEYELTNVTVINPTADPDRQEFTLEMDFATFAPSSMVGAAGTVGTAGTGARAYCIAIAARTAGTFSISVVNDGFNPDGMADNVWLLFTIDYSANATNETIIPMRFNRHQLSDIRETSLAEPAGYDGPFKGTIVNNNTQIQVGQGYVYAGKHAEYNFPNDSPAQNSISADLSVLPNGAVALIYIRTAVHPLTGTFDMASSDWWPILEVPISWEGFITLQENEKCHNIIGRALIQGGQVVSWRQDQRSHIYVPVIKEFDPTSYDQLYRASWHIEVPMPTVLPTDPTAGEENGNQTDPGGGSPWV